MKSFNWPENINEAKAVQAALKDKVRINPLTRPPHFIAGIDASFADDKVIGVACLYSYPELSCVEYAFAVRKAIFPYVPGYLTFREGPAVVDALSLLRRKPQLILVDGQGIAHPKGLGIASHIGVLLNTPTIGCAKSRLIGKYKDPGQRRGDWSALYYNGKVVGAVLRTRDGVRPLFVSPGHMIDLKSSIEIVLASTGRYRIPEPLRRADFLSKKVRRESSVAGRRFP